MDFGDDLTFLSSILLPLKSGDGDKQDLMMKVIKVMKVARRLSKFEENHMIEDEVKMRLHYHRKYKKVTSHD